MNINCTTKLLKLNTARFQLFQREVQWLWWWSFWPVGRVWKNKILRKTHRGSPQSITPTATVCRCGPWIDLCLGPQVSYTGKLKALNIHRNLTTYSWTWKPVDLPPWLQNTLRVGDVSSECQKQRYSTVLWPCRYHFFTCPYFFMFICVAPFFSNCNCL